MRIRAGASLTAATLAAATTLLLTPPAGAVPDCSIGTPAGSACDHPPCPAGEPVSVSGRCGDSELRMAPAEPAPPPLIGVI